MNGLLLIDKPYGMGSTDAVTQVKRVLPRGIKVGHAGTLDPLATGLLPIAVGEATKLLRFIVDASKTYDFTITWGERRSTADAEGEVLETSDARPTEAQLKTVLPRFLGEIMQRPPAYSAIKVGGERAYDLARAGEAVELAARPFHIRELSVLAADAASATLRVGCGKGTYVRSLAEDIARELGAVGYVSMLRRVKVGKFSVDDAFLLENTREKAYTHALSERLPMLMLGLLQALDGVPALEITESEAAALRHGQSVRRQGLAATNAEEMVAFSSGKVVAIVQCISCNAGEEGFKPLRIIHDV
ncbi:tRNA pseudouridine(55) synthase TruB [bacterium]|nr:tRNA pseudouridine(55) synthase TruB [bacterium]